MTSSAEEWVTTWVRLPECGEPVHRIEFIGDSYFVGYGNLLPESTRARDGLAPEWIDRFTDHSQSMVALCMRALSQRHNVAWRVVARSGRGAIRNYPGLEDRSPLPAVYAGLVSAATGWVVKSGRALPPELIVINLGTNDFSTPVTSEEPFAGQWGLEQAFIDGYHRFLDRLSNLYPGVVFLLVGVPHPSSDRQPTLLSQICSTRRARGESTYFSLLPEVPLTGCDGHPGVAGHRLCAEVLIHAIAQVLARLDNKPETENAYG